MVEKIRLAIIGCGAVSELFHIPIAAASDKVRSAILVDKDHGRAETLAGKFGIGDVAEDYRQVIGKVDAAILAVPHHLHAPMTVDLLKEGIHVLVEKPMALTAADCQAMISAAKQGGAVLAVGLARRFLYSHQLARKLIAEGLLGRIESFDVRDGFIYDWPVASDFFFRKETGGGVLADTGAHVLDTVLWWLGDYERFEYLDDNIGGVEADCEIHLQMKSGVKGIVELSRTRNLRNTAIVRGEKATLEVHVVGPQVSLHPHDTSDSITGNAIRNTDTASKSQSVYDLIKAQLEDWVEAIQNRREPYITGEEGARSVALIEACYKNRKKLEMPWLAPASAQKIAGSLKGKRILVTGGTGFIGGRLIERLVSDYSVEVTVLVRNFARTPQVARFPIGMIHGDITDMAAVQKAMEGCDIVFHCAYGNTGNHTQQREVTVKGTENVLRAALEHKVKRVVHVSTVSVYGKTPDGDLDESAPRKHSGDVYANSKLQAENLVFSYYKKYGLPVSIIQPTIVYGPSAPSWTLGPVNQLKSRRVILVEGGGGLCNAVYVDDVVNAMLLAATRDEAIGQAFLISAEEPVTWRDFYGAYEKMLGISSTTAISLKEVRELYRRYRRAEGTISQVLRGLREHPYILQAIIQLPAVNKLYRAARIVTPRPLWNRLRNTLSSKDRGCQSSGKPILPMTWNEIDFFIARTRIRIDKAKRLLGYQPQFTLEQGMEITERCLRFANLI